MPVADYETSDFFGWTEEPLAAEVSDYVSGRLDPLAERELERMAVRDDRVAAAIDQAKAVRRRVEQRLAVPCGAGN